jgi:KDO2-lipid IV(A) lauroyltransferase
VYLERLLYGMRADSGQIIIPKKNAFLMLQRSIRQGKSIGLFPDQSNRQGISVDFFGRKATTTPAPAILSILYKRPIVVVACCRSENGYDFEAIVSDPLWPGPYESERDEIFRLTEEMNRKIEEIVRRYPDQYFWVHNRWKTYSNNRERFR